jgi:hypothetical protein
VANLKNKHLLDGDIIVADVYVFGVVEIERGHATNGAIVFRHSCGSYDIVSSPVFVLCPPPDCHVVCIYLSTYLEYLAR